MAEQVLNFKIKSDSSQARADVKSFSSLLGKEVQAVASDFAGAAGRVGAFAAELGPVGLAVGAVAGVLVGLGAAATAATVKAVELGSRYNDLSLQTGLTVETLSGLDAQLKQSGTSAEALGNAVLFMHKNLGQAAEGNKQLQQTFRELGIEDVNAALQDTDGTLRIVIGALGKLTSEGERDRLGTEALGRAYKELRVFIADTGGDIEETLKAAREAGVVMSQEVAGNLDALGDSYDRLSNKASVMSANFIGVVAPEITKALDEINEALSGNRDFWEQWALGAAVSVARVRGVMEGAAEWWHGDTWSPWALGERMEYRAQAAEIGAVTDYLYNKANPPKPKPSPRGTVTPRARGGGRGGADKAARARMQDIQLDERETDADFRRESEALERDYRRRLDTTAQFTGQEIALLGEWIKEKRSIFDREEKEVTRSTKNEAERENKLRELQQKRTAAEDEYDRRRNAAEDRAEDERLKASEAHKDSLLKVYEASARARIQAIEGAADAGTKRESEAAQEVGDIQAELMRKQAARLWERLAQEREGSVEYKRIKGEIGVAEVQYAALVEETARRVTAAKNAEAEADRERLVALRNLLSEARSEGLELEAGFVQQAAREDDYRTRAERLTDIRQLADIERRMEGERNEREKAAIEEQKRINLEKAKTEEERVEALKLYHEQVENEMRRHLLALGQITQGQKEDEEAQDPLRSIKDLWKDFKDNARNADDSIGKSVGSLADSVVGGLGAMEGALKQGIVANILYGESLGQALKKALAAQLANLSAEFTAQGIRHSAYALGSLAFGDFAGAAKHAAAAAAFFAGAVALGKLGASVAQSAGLRGGGSAGAGAVGSTAPAPKDREFNYGGSLSTPASEELGGGSRAEGRGFMGRLLADAISAARDAQRQSAAMSAKLDATLSRIQSMPAGQVVTLGAPEAHEAIGVAVLTESTRNDGFNDTFARNMRVA